jgi:hypothetical protein
MGRTLAVWSTDQSGYDALLAYHGFGLEETCDYARAEEEGVRHWSWRRTTRSLTTPSHM